MTLLVYDYIFDHTSKIFLYNLDCDYSMINASKIYLYNLFLFSEKKNVVLFSVFGAKRATAYLNNFNSDPNLCPYSYHAPELKGGAPLTIKSSQGLRGSWQGAPKCQDSNQNPENNGLQSLLVQVSFIFNDYP